MAFGDEDTEHKYIKDLEKTGLTTTDIDPVDPNQPKGMKRQKTDPTYNVGEARINPEQNVKAESGKKELLSIAKTISDPEDWAISMTSQPKLGINPQAAVSEDTPKGIYFYPLDYALSEIKRNKPLPWGDNMPYIQLFQYDRSNQMTQQTKVDSVKLKQALSKYCPPEIMQQAEEEGEYDGTPYWYIYDCLSRLGKSDETNIIRWNKVLRDLGFTSVFDPGNGWIAYNEPTQGVVLDPRIIKQHKTIANRKESKVITPARIAQLLFDEIDMELARNRIWQLYDPDGSKLRQAVKKYAEDPKFKPYMGKPGSQELEDKIKGYRLYGARQLSDVAMEWYKAQQPVNEVSLGNTISWPEVANKISSAMKAMGWKGQRKGDDSYLFSTKGAEDESQYYMVMIDNEGNGMFTYALGTWEEGRPDIGEQGTLPTTEASVSEVLMAIRDGYGLNEGLVEASGYIPSKKEKNDPRFKTALTVDVKPDSIKKNAKAFSWLTSRAGIPPDARPDGKI
jgi:hypothetical protein